MHLRKTTPSSISIATTLALIVCGTTNHLCFGEEERPPPMKRSEVFKHTRSINDRVFDIWRSPGRFTKNPDIIRLSSGRLMLVYADTDGHWSQEDQVLTLLASDDNGQTWFKHKEILAHDLREGDERLITPRLSRLNDGRLVVLIDQDDYGHVHENQPSGILVLWSKDQGETWSGPFETGILGIEPDRMMDLPDGRLAVCSHLVRAETQEFAEILSCSEDGGKTWYEESTIAHDGFYRYCEGALVILDGGKELACVMRENHWRVYPSFVAFSKDMGKTWSKPQMAPFGIHRPYAKQLEDGRVLVTGRHVNGGYGSYGWCGDLRAEAGRYQIGGPAGKYSAELTSDALVIENIPDHTCRYKLLAPESPKSRVLFEAELKVEGAGDEPVAFLAVSRIRGSTVLYIAPDWIGLTRRERVDLRKDADMTKYRHVALHSEGGLLKVLLDGKTIINRAVFWDSNRLFYSPDRQVGYQTEFGQLGESGRSHWRSVSYDVVNPTQPPFQWSWKAGDGQWPDQYQRDHLIQIHGNPRNQKHSPGHRPDHGYSSWLVLPDKRIMFVDYTTFGDTGRQGHLVGAYITMDDLKPVVTAPLGVIEQ